MAYRALFRRNGSLDSKAHVAQKTSKSAPHGPNPSRLIATGTHSDETFQAQHADGTHNLQFNPHGHQQQPFPTPGISDEVGRLLVQFRPLTPAGVRSIRNNFNDMFATATDDEIYDFYDQRIQNTLAASGNFALSFGSSSVSQHLLLSLGQVGHFGQAGQVLIQPAHPPQSGKPHVSPSIAQPMQTLPAVGMLQSTGNDRGHHPSTAILSVSGQQPNSEQAVQGGSGPVVSQSGNTLPRPKVRRPKALPQAVQQPPPVVHVAVHATQALKFQDMPAELRTMVWEYIFREPRLSNFYRDAPDPASRANSEARSVFQKLHPLLHDQVKRNLYFHVHANWNSEGAINEDIPYFKGDIPGIDGFHLTPTLVEESYDGMQITFQLSSPPKS